jgi:hypothetical protein
VCPPSQGANDLYQTKTLAISCRKGQNMIDAKPF